MLLRNLLPPKLCNGTRLCTTSLGPLSIRGIILTGRQGRNPLHTPHTNCHERRAISIQKTATAVTTCVRHDYEQSSRTINSVLWYQSGFAMFFAWSTICSFFQSKFTRKFIRLLSKGYDEEYCLSRSIVNFERTHPSGNSE